MFEQLKKFIHSTISISNRELALVEEYFVRQKFPRKTFLHEASRTCNWLGFLEKGMVRHFHLHDGSEQTCDLTVEGGWISDFSSFTQNKPGVMYLYAMEDCIVDTITRSQLEELYERNPKFRAFGQLMTERVAQRATQIAMSLSTLKPEQRYLLLLEEQPELFQRVPNKYLAGLIGISPESLSRLQRRLSKKS